MLLPDLPQGGPRVAILDQSTPVLIMQSHKSLVHRYLDSMGMVMLGPIPMDDF
jgi:hypothetical protein